MATLKLFSHNPNDLKIPEINIGKESKLKISYNITNKDSIYLINQSITGLYQEYINLKTVQPKINKQ